MNNSTKTTNILDTALAWHGKNVNPLPIRAGTKKAAVHWEKWQGQRVPLALVRSWFSKPDVSLALMCGTISGNLCVMDFDDVDLYQTWAETHKYHYAKSYTVKTGRPGRHVYFRLDEVPDKTIALENLDIKVSGYVLAPPSPRYTPVDPTATIMRAYSVDTIVTLDTGIAGLNCLKCDGRAEGAQAGHCVQIDGDGNTVTINSNHFRQSGLGASEASEQVQLPHGIIAQIKSRVGILQVLEWYSIDMQGPGNQGYYWGLCCCHDDTNPSLSADVRRNKCHCWSPGCKLHTDKGLDVIDLVARIEGIPAKQAMQRLAVRAGLVQVDQVDQDQG